MSESFQSQQLAAIESRGQLSLLSDINQQGKAAFQQAEFPTRKHESWKYTNLRALKECSYTDSSETGKVETLLSNAQALSSLIPNTSAGVRLVFVDGHLSNALSDDAALTLMTPFSKANEEQQDIIRQHLGNTKSSERCDNFLLKLNNAAINDGVFVHIGRHQQLDTKLHVVYVSSGGRISHHQRLLVVLEAGATATVAEYFVSSDENDHSLTTATTEIVVGDNAALTHYRTNTQQQDALFFGGCYVDLQRDARYHGFHLGLGSRVNRHDIRVEHCQGGSHCDLNGVYVPQNEQLVDFHTAIEHGVAHCTSNEVFRGIMNDKAKAVFNGRIHIHPDAQKTLAEMSNKNLLMTNTAEINTKPELEIYADDVRCAHGATVAQLDDQALFYLMSRGISRAEAEVMMSFGFINELIESLADLEIRDWLRPILAYRFGRQEALVQHLVK